MHDISLRKEGADIKKDVVVSSNLDLLFLSPLAFTPLLFVFYSWKLLRKFRIVPLFSIGEKVVFPLV